MKQFSSWEHLMVQFPAPVWQLTVIYDSRPRGHLKSPLAFQGTTNMWNTYIPDKHAYTWNKNVSKKEAIHLCFYCVWVHMHASISRRVRKRTICGNWFCTSTWVPRPGNQAWLQAYLHGECLLAPLYFEIGVLWSPGWPPIHSVNQNSVEFCLVWPQTSNDWN